MSKLRTVYVCEACEYQSAKWLGKCPQCGAWNRFAEDVVSDEPKKNARSGVKRLQAHARPPESFQNILKNLSADAERTPTGITELDRVLGSGVVPGSLILLSGEPGIGKSTLTLQICDSFSKRNKNVLYISGEESAEQISMRGKRLGLKLASVKLMTENNLESAITAIQKEKPDFIVIDSIQVLYSGELVGGAGTISQVRFCTEALLEQAKGTKTPVLIIGHVTKDGNLAGPRVLEHLVDTVLFFEGDRNHEFRILRGIKNRFGPTNEVGVFSMTEKGLTEIKNPSERFLQERQIGTPGTAVVCTVEGSRAFLVEVQALTSKTQFGYPRRTASGFDVNRLQLLLAVIERHLNVNVGTHDVYLNVVGGMQLNEPACDLGVCLAVLSSLKKTPLPKTLVAVGEVGLTGEIRAVSHADIRKKEASRLGLVVDEKKLLKEFLKLFA